MSREARRRHILDTARELLLQRPGEQVSTADIATAAGVTRALVHHYFRGINELREAVSLDIARDTPHVLAKGPETPLAERVRHNTSAMLDVIDANRHVWLAYIAAEGDVPAATPASGHVRATILAQMLANNSDVVADTPWARLCLSGYLGFAELVCRRWVLGETDRESVQRALTETLLALLTDVIPAGGPGQP